MVIRLRKSFLALTLASSWAVCDEARAQAITAQQALGIAPVQSDVDCDRPNAADIAKCTVRSERIAGKPGWVVRDENDQILRNFIDSNGDNKVDLWCYFKSGIEIYRDFDSDFNGKADQCRWLTVGGSRWGIDRNEDGKIDHWKSISAEEVTSEVVAAIANQDAARFARLLATPAEIDSLGLEAARAQELTAKVGSAANAFAKLVKEKRILTPAAKWVHFGGGRPGAVAGTDGKGDLVVYENVSAMVDTAGKSDQVEVGTLVRIGDTWRLLDVPRELADAATVSIYKTPDQRDAMQMAGAQPNDAMLENLKKLEEIDKKIAEASNPEQLAKLNANRADLVELLAKDAANATDKAMWYRDLGDTVLAAIQMNGYPDGLDRLKKAAAAVAEDPESQDTAASLNYRIIKAEYFLAQQDGNNFAKMQADWLTNLEKFVTDFPQAEDTAEAMMELATANEFAGNDTKALEWWGEIVIKFPNSNVGATAKGAKTRLESVGKQIVISGRRFSGTPGVASLANLKNKVVLVHYWSSEMDLCRSELPQLKNLLAKYGSKFAIFSISLDRDPEALKAFLTAEKLPWEVIYEPGGISSRLATEMGIYTMPTMLLVDGQGRVLNRDIHTAELEGELRKLLTPRQASR